MLSCLMFSCSMYHKLKLCVDSLASTTSCTGRGSLDDFFLKVHNTYFSSCGQIREPPLTIVILLMAPLTLLTLVLPHLCVFLTTKDTEISCWMGLWCSATGGADNDNRKLAVKIKDRFFFLQRAICELPIPVFYQYACKKRSDWPVVTFQGFPFPSLECVT